MMTLPLFVTRKNKYLTGALMYGLSYYLYYIINHNPLYEPKMLPLTWVDEKAPFLPWSVLIYVSEYLFFGVVYYLLKNYNNINKYLYSYFMLQMVSCMIFVMYPTILPRDNFPIPTDLPLWLQSIWTWLRTQDAPTNCLPSLHVASVYLSAFVFRTDGQKKTFWIMVIWGTFIALSTLTTKQHYLADIVLGLGLALFFYWWFHHEQSYERIWPKMGKMKAEPAA
jgi:membrane-associated phospholipid phosphatase